MSNGWDDLYFYNSVVKDLLLDVSPHKDPVGDDSQVPSYDMTVLSLRRSSPVFLHHNPLQNVVIAKWLMW